MTIADKMAKERKKENALVHLPSGDDWRALRQLELSSHWAVDFKSIDPFLRRIYIFVSRLLSPTDQLGVIFASRSTFLAIQ